MGLVDRFWTVIKTNLNTIVSEAEDPEKLLADAIDQMQQELIGVRQAVAQAVALSKRTERQIKNYQALAQQWYSRAQLSLSHNHEDLARAALSKRQTYLEQLQPLEHHHQEQLEIITQLKKQMALLEQKLSETKMKRDMYLARVKSATAAQKLQSLTFNLEPGSLGGVLEKLEQKVLELEAEVQLYRDPIENQFQSLEQSQKIETELTKIKNQPNLSPPPLTPAPLPSEDWEIQRLKRELEQI